jgi:hypothetical protein
MHFQPGDPLGAAPYGDDARDQAMIILGYEFYQAYSVALAATPDTVSHDSAG